MEHLSDEKRLEKIIEWLTTRHLDTEGGYPYDSAVIGDKVVIASLDPAKDCRTQIEVYETTDLIQWHRRAERFAAEDEDFTLETAFYETEE